MRHSVARLAQAAKTAAAPATGSTGAPSPYAWVNTATAGPSSGPLSGRAIAIKDNISYTGAPTSCGSDILEGYVPPYDATCVKLLTAAGAHISGKTKMDEFGMGSQNTHMAARYSPVHNPGGPAGDSDPRSPGGSSGGSAAAVAEGSSWAALGTDTGGSVRLPASYCGVVGYKPSYGMISRYGVVSYADSLDCVGILARTTNDVRTVFGVVSQPDEHDMTCASASDRKKAAAAAATSVDRPLRIGIPVQTHLEQPNLQLPPALLEHLQSLGATLHPVNMPSFSMALPAYYVLACAEAASNLGRFGGSWYGSTWEKSSAYERDGEPSESGTARRRRIRTTGFGDEVRKRILAGTYALTADAFNNSYLKALQLRRAVRRDFANVLRTPHPLQRETAPENGVDVLLFPTAVGTAPVLGQAKGGAKEYLQDLLTVPASLAGLPAISVPAGRGKDRWPVGVSLVGQWGCDEVVFRAAEEVEKWNK